MGLNLTLRVLVWVVLESVETDLVDVLQELAHRLVVVQVDLRHHRRQVHRVLDDLIVVWHLR